MKQLSTLLKRKTNVCQELTDLVFSLQGKSFKLGRGVWRVADGLQDAPVPVVLLLLLFPLTRSRLQLCQAPRLDKEKEWT